MLKFITLLLFFLRAMILLCKPQGSKALIAENLMLRMQFIKLSRKQKRSPRLSFIDRVVFATLAQFINTRRLLKSAIIIKPATILKFHKALIKKKYRLLFSAKKPRKPGPKGPSKELTQLILEMKRRNPRFGYLSIAMQINNMFDINIDKDVVRRILHKHYKHLPGNNDGPSWLTSFANIRDSLWSIDFFKCESILLKSHWVMVIMDQFSRRIIGFATYMGDLNGIAICCMFNSIISKQALPTFLSSDNDPLFQYHRWKANLRILDIKEIKTLSYIPMSHPFVERLIRSIRNELLDQTLFWNAEDLQRKLDHYQHYFNLNRSHKALIAATPYQKSFETKNNIISIYSYKWQSHCKGLFQLPIPA